jgi:hypothetical protein
MPYIQYNRTKYGIFLKKTYVKIEDCYDLAIIFSELNFTISKWEEYKTVLSVKVLIYRIYNI